MPASEQATQLSSLLRESFGSQDRYARVQALKQRYDPDNAFRLSQIIDPDGGNSQ